jgi:hypothetical protein
MDHVSISWGIDEELSTRTAKNVTFQRSLISEALNIAGHQNYPPGTKHGYAASVGGDVASLHHNLLAHNEGRNWSMAGGLDGAGYYSGRLDIFNNVVYNWGGRTTDGGAHEVNFVANYYKPGAASTYYYALNAQYGGFPGTQQYFFNSNVMIGYFTVANQAAGRTRSTETGGTLPTTYDSWVSNAFFPSYATIHTVTNAYKRVLSDVGCSQPQIDDHDVRVIRETIDGTYTYTGTGPYGGSPGLPNSQDDVGGWEDYGSATRPANWDTDHDGLPDWWEVIKGLNPNSPPGDFSDSNGDPDGDEYTNLEDYLNWLAQPHYDATNGTALDVDLNWLTRGFTNNSPVYTVSGATNGTVTLVAGKTARFTSSVNSNALGSFLFSVTDAAGDSMTNYVNVRLIPSVVSSNPPAITTQPASITNLLGTTATLRVSASGTSPLAYQWRFNGTNLAGATDTNLVLANVQMTNAGNYLAVVTNAYGSVTSSVATLVVNRLPVAGADKVARSRNRAANIKFADLLANDSDPDLDSLAVIGVSTTTNGVVLTTNTTDIFYTNAANLSDRFTYTVSDRRGGTAIGTVDVYVQGISSFQLSGAGGATNVINFAGVPGWQYVLQFSTNLTSNSWAGIATNTMSANGQWTVTNTIGSATQGFYRFVMP